MIRRRAILSGLAAVALPLLDRVWASDGGGWPKNAAPDDIEAALQLVPQWLAAYQTGDYLTQWRLTDPRIRQWRDRRRWRDGMRSARRRNGALLSYTIRAHSAVAAQNLPCTEMGHCFRKDVDYVLVLIDTKYEIAAPAQPEFFVCARSAEGWRFGGGTILNRPLGETSVILTIQDERRYHPKLDITR